MQFLEDAPNRLYRYFSDGSWEIYDGVTVENDANLTICDIVLSAAINSRINRNSVWGLWNHKDQIENGLSRIPVEITLESDNIPWNDLESLFDTFCNIASVAEAVTTKILHKKRPELIPICDSVLYTYFKPHLKDVWSRGGGRFIVKYMKVFRDVLLEYENEIYALCDIVKREGWPISPVRALEVLIWIAEEPNGEYR